MGARVLRTGVERRSDHGCSNLLGPARSRPAPHRPRRAARHPVEPESRAGPPAGLAARGLRPAAGGRHVGELARTARAPADDGRLVRQPAPPDAELSRLRRARPGGTPGPVWLVHHRGADRRDRSSVRLGRRRPADRLELLPRGGRRPRDDGRRALPADFRQPGGQRPEVHPRRGPGPRRRAARGGGLVGDRHGHRAGHPRRGADEGLRAVLPPPARRALRFRGAWARPGHLSRAGRSDGGDDRDRAGGRAGDPGDRPAAGRAARPRTPAGSRRLARSRRPPVFVRPTEGPGRGEHAPRPARIRPEGA